MRTGNTLNWLIVLGGIWLVISPFVLLFAGFPVPLWNNILVGVAFIILAAWAALSNNLGTKRTLDWINVILGIWLLISPFVLAYAFLTGAMWNDVIVGIIMIILAGWAAVSYRRGPVEEYPPR